MHKKLTYKIVTFGCQQNMADSERIAAVYKNHGYSLARSVKSASEVIINTCMIRESAENRVYGLVHNLSEEKRRGRELKITLTGCMVGMAIKEKSGKILRRLREVMPSVDEFLPIEEVGFDIKPLRIKGNHAWVPISNGCNNYCTYCVVPFTRGRETSRPYQDIMAECRQLVSSGYTHLTLLGQNVNSYGSDLLKKISGQADKDKDYDRQYFQTTLSKKRTDPLPPEISSFKPVYVKHLGRLRIPTLFPYLLADVAVIPGIEEVNFLSSNPWDFSDQLISVVAKYPTVTKTLHLPVQSGDTEVLRRMNRWYTRAQYLHLVDKIRKAIPSVELTTDIIVGFCGETEAEFQNTVHLVKQVNFAKAYISIYSDRKITAAHQAFQDDVPYSVKRRRWLTLDRMVNRQHYEKD